MRDLKLEDGGKSISLMELNLFMEESNLKLPQSYIKFFLSENGGYPNLGAFGNPYEDGSIVDCFYSISLEEHEFNEDKVALLPSREIIKTHQVLENNIPSYLYPFASEESGANFCISMGGENEGAIYLVFLDGTSGEPTFICNSFDKFLDGLEDVEKYDKD